MSHVAPSPGPFHRFADQFGRVAALVTVLGVGLALVLTVPPTWLDGIFSHEAPASAYAELSPAEPVRVSAAGVGLASPLIASQSNPLAMLDDPPVDSPLVSWWAESAMPGAAHGQTLLVAHTDGDHGALTEMTGLTRGSTVDVLTESGTMRYEVDRVRTLDPEKMGRAQITLFKQDGGFGRLVMVSQEGWDGSSYARSVVVTAEPLGSPDPA